jgi:hypothetical protein
MTKSQAAWRKTRLAVHERIRTVCSRPFADGSCLLRRRWVCSKEVVNSAPQSGTRQSRIGITSGVLSSRAMLSAYLPLGLLAGSDGNARL